MTQYQRPSNGGSECSIAPRERLPDDALLDRADSSNESMLVAVAAGEIAASGAVGWGCEALHPSAYGEPVSDAGFAAGGVG